VNAPLDFWRNNAALRHITPEGARWAEGDAMGDALQRLMPRGTKVLDFGCGDGRMVEFFVADDYVGVDVNPFALAHCRARFPTRTFVHSDPPLPFADAVLCYAVLLHIEDAAVSDTIQRLVAAAPRVIVVEILGRRWRGRPELEPQTFNRELNDYRILFEPFGFRLLRIQSLPYARYAAGTKISVMEFVRE